MANSYPASGQVILDDLKVCTNARLQPHFVSYGEHMFMNLESAHNNSYLPVVTFSRAGCTLGAIGLDRASNSDAIGNYAESEMVIGTRAATPTSIQSNGVRRLMISADGRIGIGSCNYTLGGFNAKMLIKQTSNGDWTGLQISDAADENVINFGYNGTDFLISQSWRQGGGPIKNLKIGLGCQLFLRNDGNVGIGTTGPSTKLHIINKIDRVYTPNSFNDTSHALHIDFCNQNQRAGLIRWTSHGNLENSFGVVQVGCAAAGCGQGDFVFQAYKEAGGSGYSELMRLTNGGNIGIGTTIPDSKLHICNAVSGGTNNYSVIIQNACTVADARSGIAFSNNSQTPSAGGLSGASIQSSNNGIDGTGNLLFGTLLDGANTERMRISHNGNVGIGCSVVRNTLEIVGPMSSPALCATNCDVMKIAGVSNSSLSFGSTSASPYPIWMQVKHQSLDNLTYPLSLQTCGGNVGIGVLNPGSYKLYVNGSFYSAGSSCEYKTSICQYNTDSCMFMKLKPVTYQYKDEWCHLGKELKSGTQIGLIAEDTADVFPELAILKEEDEQKVVRNVDYEKLSIILLSEVQKLRKEVDNLKNNK